MQELVVLTSSLRTMVPIIKVVGDFCNLKCSYCFYNQRDQLTPHVMSQELLEKFIRQYFELFTGSVMFIWHGGEPLLAGVEFFRNIVASQKRYAKPGHRIINTIQTNATLIDQNWAEFFRDNDFGVGVSLDGTKESHDRHRINHAGRGAFDAVRNGVQTLEAYGVRPGFIQTLTKSNLNRAAQDFDFFTDVLKARGWGTNIFFDPQGFNPSMLSENVTPSEMTAYIKQFIDLWLERDDSGVKVREIENFILGVTGKRATSCTFNGACTSYFCLEYDGRVYPCDRLSNRDDLLFGNLSKNDLVEVLNSSGRFKYATDVNRLHPDCASCRWQNACHNGCTMHRNGSIDGKYYYCESRKAIFAYLEEKLAERGFETVNQKGDKNVWN